MLLNDFGVTNIDPFPITVTNIDTFRNWEMSFNLTTYGACV